MGGVVGEGLGPLWAKQASRRALSSMNSESFCPCMAAARLNSALVSAETRIWITSCLGRAEAGMANTRILGA